MYKLFGTLIFSFIFSILVQAQVTNLPEAEVLHSYKCKRSCSFSESKLQKKLVDKKIKMLDTLSNANCFLVEVKHKQGSYAILKKKKNCYQLVYLNFQASDARPYFVNDSIDFNRDKKNEVVLYYTTTLTALPEYSSFNGTKTGLQIININKRRALLNCELTLCGLGVKTSTGTQVGACLYQYSISFMPMRVVVTGYTDKSTFLPLLPPHIVNYNLKRSHFVRQAN